MSMNIYIARHIFMGILTAFIIIVGMILLIDFVELSRTIGQKSGVNFFDVAKLTGLKAPSLLQEILPFIVLFGAMSSLSKLNRKSELIIMRAAGLSAWRFLLPGIFVVGLLGIIWSAVLNPIAVRAQLSFNQARTELTSPTKLISSEQSLEKVMNIWLSEGARTGQTKIYAEIANINTSTLYKPTFYLFRYDHDGNAELTNRFDALKAELSSKGYWVLNDVIDTPADGGIALPYETTTLKTKLTQDDLLEATNTKKSVNFWQMPAEIKRLKEAGFSPKPVLMDYHKLLAMPLSLISMMVISAGVSMILTRLGGTLRLMIIGATLGFGVYFANNMITAFGQTGSLPAILSVWAVPIFVLFAGLARLSWLEDG